MLKLRTAVVAWLCLGAALLVAQDANPHSVSSKRTVLDAIKAIDLNLAKDQDWVVPFLESTLEKDPNDSLASTILAIAQIRDQNFTDASKTLASANESGLSGVTRSTNGKLRLLCAINLEDEAMATKLFSALVEASQRETTSEGVRKSYCIWLGEIIGLIDNEEAKPPIDRALIVRARKTLLATPIASLSEAFQHQYALAKSRADRIVINIAKRNQLGEDGFNELEQTLETEIAEAEEKVTIESKDRKDFVSENATATKAVRLDIAANRAQLREAEQEWARITPGLPTPIAAPILPRRELIYVDPYFWQWGSRIVNGQRSDYQYQSPRSSYDIESERNAIFQSQMSAYNGQLTFFQNFQRELANWKKADAERRNSLSALQKQLVEQSNELRNQLAQLELDKKQNGGNTTVAKKAISQQSEDLQAIRAVRAAFAVGKPHLALVPSRIDPWLITDEKNRLLKLATR
jgi:hypothetical protein